MGTPKRTVVARRLFEFAEIVGDRNLIQVAVGPGLHPVLLTVEGEPDDRIESPGWASFPKQRADRISSSQ